MKHPHPAVPCRPQTWTSLALILALLVGWTSAFAADKTAKKLPKAPKNLQISAPTPSKVLRRGRTGASVPRLTDLKTAGDSLTEARRAIAANQQALNYADQQIATLPDGPRKNEMFAQRRNARDALRKWIPEAKKRQDQFKEAATNYVVSHNKWTDSNPRPDAADAPQATPAPRGVTPNPAAFPRAVSAGAPPPVPPRRQVQAVSSGAAAPRPRFEPIAAGPEDPDDPAALIAPPVPAAADDADPDDPPPAFNPALAGAAQAGAAQPNASAQAAARQAAVRPGQQRAAAQAGPPPAIPPKPRPAAGANPGQRIVYEQLPGVAVQTPGGGLQQRDARAGPAGQAAGLLRGVQRALVAGEQVLVSPL